MSKFVLVVMFLLPLHACKARHTFDLVSSSKDAEKTKIVHEINLMTFSMFEDTQKTSSSGRAEEIPSATLHKSLRSPTEVQGLKGKPRTILESKSHENKHKPTGATEGEEPVEDAVVMDYVAPRRKSPIHNHH